MLKDQTIKDSVAGGWVEHMPARLRPFLRLSRYDRPIGFWLLALPGWIGLCFAGLTEGFMRADLKWALLIALGAIAMRGAGCTYNDIVDRDLDKQVQRTALRPLAAGTVSVKSAWIWLGVQCFVGLAVLAFFPRLSQIIAVSSLVLVAAYPFMKRITYWPQAWLGLTFNWAVLVAYTAKTGAVTPALCLLYGGLIFWTIGYDTIYACQDKEDDALIGIKSTARLFGDKVGYWIGFLYIFANILIFYSLLMVLNDLMFLLFLPFFFHLMWQYNKFTNGTESDYLALFKSNLWAGLLLVFGLTIPALARML